jgi:glycosyltransferase involved in cell wall biosynthesis
MNEEIEKTKKFLNVPKIHDIIFIGPMFEKKIKLISELRQQKYRVDYIESDDSDVNIRVGKAHILMHVHKDESKYDSSLEKWRLAGMKIMVEECPNAPQGVRTFDLKNIGKKLYKYIGKDKLKPIKIGLCMIVKNESHIVHEVLNCTLPLIDTFCILDTGSTDNTVKIIRDFYEKNNIKGEVVESDWKGFGESRSEALKLCDGKMDYILMIDADDLIVHKPDMKNFLYKMLYETNPNACNIHIKRGSLEYERTQIFKANDDWRYVGVLHEYPTNDKKNNVMIRLPNEIHMIGRTMGARSLIDGNKYKRDAETILEALKKEPTNDRYMFYLAQSYRDAGMHPEAIEWYTKRFEAGGWVEEQYICALNLTRLLKSKDWAWKAHEIFPRRSESLVSYMTYCRMTNSWSRELLSMAMYASTIPKPEGTLLFLEVDNYEWRVWDELSVISVFCGALEIARSAYMKLLKDNKFPPDQETRIKTNFKLVIEAMAQKK